MANTITRGGSFVTLTTIDTDLVCEDLWPEQCESGVPIISIDFVIGAAGDKAVIREGSLTGPIIFGNDAGVSRLKSFAGRPIRPCLDVSEGTYNSAAALIFHIGQI